MCILYPIEPVRMRVALLLVDSVKNIPHCLSFHVCNIYHIELLLASAHLSHMFSGFCMTKVVEKIQAEEGVAEDGRYVYRFKESPMCPYMILFIEKVQNLGNPEVMNKVLENFSVVQVVRDTQSQKVLFCTAYLFEVSMRGFGTRHHVYRLFEQDIGLESRRFTT